MYKGQIKDFPKEVVEKMLEYQVAQGNPKDVSVFEKDETSDVKQGGFSWDKAGEISFWNKVIMKKDFDLFFEKYPKSENKLDETKQPEQWFEVGQTVYSHLFPEGEGVVKSIGNPSEFLPMLIITDSIKRYFTLDGRLWETRGIVISQTPLEPIKNKVIEKCPFDFSEWVAVKNYHDSIWTIVQFSHLIERKLYVDFNGIKWQQCKKLSEFNI